MARDDRVSPEPFDEAGDDLDVEADAEALSWDGDEELGRSTSLTDPNPEGARRRRAELSADDDADFPLADDPDVPSGADAGAAIAARTPADRARSLGTVLFGILLLAWSVGWILTVSSAVAPSTGAIVTDVMSRFGDFLTLIATPLWFAAAIYLTRESRTRVRVGWLALGAGLLVPWPTVIGLFA